MKLIFIFSCIAFLSVQSWARLSDDIPVRINLGSEINPVWYVGAFEKEPLTNIPTSGENADGGRYSLRPVGSHKGYQLMDISTENCDPKTARKKYQSEQELSSQGQKENADEIVKKNVRGRRWKKAKHTPSHCRGLHFEYLEMLEPYGPKTTTIQMCFYKGNAEGKAFWITRDYDGLELSRKELVYKEGILQSSLETVTEKRIKVREKQIQAIQSKGRPVYKVSEYTCRPQWRRISKKWVMDGNRRVLRVTIEDPLGKKVALVPIEDIYKQAQEQEAKAASGSDNDRRSLLPGSTVRGTK